jgi:hypothetical protein
MRFRRRPETHRRADGSAITPATKAQPDGTLVRAPARAWRWQQMLDEGIYASVSDIGDAENISKSRVSRISGPNGGQRERRPKASWRTWRIRTVGTRSDQKWPEIRSSTAVFGELMH